MKRKIWNLFLDLMILLLAAAIAYFYFIYGNGNESTDNGRVESYVMSTAEPTIIPTSEPTPTATVKSTPTATPTVKPTATPTVKPTATPTAKPTATPTVKPTATPTAKPTATPTVKPTATPTVKPTVKPTVTPTAKPTATPTATPTVKPTAAPTATSTLESTPQTTNEDLIDVVGNESRKYLQVGDVIKLGRYESNGNITDGTEPIEWTVLATEGEFALLTTVYVIDVKCFNSVLERITYEDSTLRAWLNNEFYTIAFDNGEHALIIPTTHTLEDDTTEGIAIVDRVFVLSESEVQKYLPGDKDRLCYPTEYAKMHGAMKNNGAAAYWLCAPTTSRHKVVYVKSDGMIMGNGAYFDDKYIGIRPCIWIKTDREP